MGTMKEKQRKALECTEFLVGTFLAISCIFWHDGVALLTLIVNHQSSGLTEDHFRQPKPLTLIS